jgi:predicted RNase H-like HicB family nuclease
MFGGCHGDDELSVFQKLQQLVDEVIDLYHKDGKPLPAATAGHDLANRLQDVA